MRKYAQKVQNQWLVSSKADGEPGSLTSWLVMLLTTSASEFTAFKAEALGLGEIAKKQGRQSLIRTYLQYSIFCNTLLVSKSTFLQKRVFLFFEGFFCFVLFFEGFFFVLFFEVFFFFFGKFDYSRRKC